MDSDMHRPSPHREPEHRLVTVLFADISGFTSMAENMDPEDLTFLMNRCFGLMESVVEAYGGTIDKFIGDCIMALFGVPNAVEKGPLKAIQTAIEIKERLYRLNNEKNLPAPLDVHMGINTGVVVAGEVGGEKRREYTVMGDAVNVAAKLEGASHAGQILVGSATYRSAREKFRFRTLRPIKIDGKKNLVQVYELLSGKKSGATGESSVKQPFRSDLVGREKELGTLKCHLQKILSGEGAVISLTGEAGIGKSRLISVLKKDKRIEQVLLLEGHANAVGKNLRFHPIVDLLKNWSGITAHDDDEKGFQKLEKAVKSVLSEKSDEALPFIAVLMGLHLPERCAGQIRAIEGSALETLISKNIRELLCKLSSLTPLVVVMEDLHWVDNSSALLLAALFDLVTIQPILFINIFRPQHGDIPDLMMEEASRKFSGHYFKINVLPLNNKQTNLLIINLLSTRHLPSTVKKMILQRAGGNPFFVEEVLHALIDRGAMVHRNGLYKVTDKMEEVIIPQNINDVVMERVDRLDDNTRHVLGVASVVGQAFSSRVISEVLSAKDSVRRALRSLKRAQFIMENGNWLGTDLCFKHAIAREIVYRSILHRTRKSLHRRIAAAMESVYEKRLGPVCGMLAFHYGRGEDLEKAEQFMVKAGEEALRAGASSEALHFYKEALDFYLKKYKDVADPEKIKMMKRNIARSLLDRGQHAEALEYYTKALACYGLKGFRFRPVIYFGFLISFCNLLVSLYLPLLKWRKVPTQREIEILQLLYHRAAAQSSLEPRYFVMASFYLSRRLSKFDLTRFEGGVGMLIGLSIALSWSVASFGLSRKILAFVKFKVRPGDIRSRLYYNLSEILQNYYSGRLKNRYNDRLVALGLKIGEISHTSAYISYHGRIKIECGMYEAASDLVARLAEIGRTYSHGFAWALKYFLNTKLLMKSRKLYAALIEAEEGIRHLDGMDFMQIVMILHLCRVRIHLLLSDSHAAQGALDEAETFKTKTRVLPPYMSNYLMSVALIDLFRLDTAHLEQQLCRIHRYRKQALASCRRMIQGSRKIAYDRPEACRVMGTCLWLAGRPKPGLRYWKRSIAECRQLGARVELARSYMEIGKRLIEPGARYTSLEGVSGEQYLFKAEMLFLDLGLLWDLRALKGIFPRRKVPGQGSQAAG